MGWKENHEAISARLGISVDTGTGVLATWCNTADLLGFDDELTTFNDLDDYCQMATDILYVLSGRKFAQAQQQTVRPSSTSTFCQHWGTGIEGTDLWLIAGDPFWTGQMWGDGSAGCGYRSKVRLAGHIRSIDSVKIDGVTIDPSAYHVEDYVWLVRGDGSYWPVCQDLGAACGAVGSFCVEYTWGQELPTLAVQAAVELGDQLARWGHNLKNQLPRDWTQITRQGLSVGKSQATGSAGSGASGLPMVDLFLFTYNPQGRRRAPTVWSPDTPSYGRTVQ